MNKKLIVGIIAGILALVLIVVAAVLIIKSIDIKDGDSSSDISLSDVTDASSGSDADGSDSSTGDLPAVEEGNVGIGSAEGKASDTVKVPISLNKNPGIFAGQYYFEYDSSVLEYVGYEEGDLFDEYSVNQTDGVINFIINAKELADVTDNGTLVILEFKIKDDAKAGDYAITLGEKTLICNLDEQTVVPEIEEGKITVK